MQNNSKINTALLSIIIVLLLVGIYLMVTKKETPNELGQVTPGPQLNTTDNTQNTQNNTPPVTPPENNNPVVPAGWSMVSENGMSATIPAGYSHNTEFARAAGFNAVTLNIGSGNKLVVSIYKWNNQVLFNESVPQGVSSDYTLINNNYQISGLTGKYYQRSTAIGGGNLIVVPSKLVVIDIQPASFIGVPQAIIDQIVASIKL